MALTKNMTTEFINEQYLLHGEKIENAPYETEYYVFDRFGDMWDTKFSLFSGTYDQCLHYINGIDR